MKTNDRRNRSRWTPGELRLAGAAGVIAALTFSLAACGSSSPGTAATAATASGQPAAITVQLDYLENTQFGGSFIADSDGYYKAGGLGVTLLPDGSNAAVEPLVESGKALIGITHTTALAAAVSNGATDLRVIGAGYQKNPFSIISKASAPIDTPRDLIGKKIGVATANQPLFTAYLKANGIDAGKVRVVTVQYDPTPLADGQVDGYVGFYNNEPIVLREKGVDVHTLLMNDSGLPFMEELYIVRSSSLQDATKRARITAFMKAERQGWQGAIDDPAKAAQLAVSIYGKDLKLDLAQQTAEAKAQNELVTSADTKSDGLFWMSPANVAATVKSLQTGGTTVSPDLFTNEILSAL
jgi:ABC-type nitrate/sulfonate/bicarbonate transport system substrate-binding protein